MNGVRLVSAILVASAGWYGSAHAQVSYNNTALNGCYAHLGTSVDTGSSTVGRDTVGTLCFDGMGNIVGTAGSTGLSGHVTNTDGTVTTTSDQTGTYKVTNYPGDGMGVFKGTCTEHSFVLRNVDTNGLAHGFSYIRTKVKKGCKDTGPLVVGGGGEYQGPLK
ncbi:MAG TPA: hypothetical protein VHT03_01760 [Rhizomicrobium sp.]|jgi:hypothetical protein|nr:hypothetical protein [Rhizomicrobium sp.]